MFQGWEMCLKSTLDTISGCKSFYSTSWCKSIERHNSKITLFFHNIRIHTIEGYAFAGSEHISMLVINDNPIKIVDSFAFAGLKHVKFLLLSSSVKHLHVVKKQISDWLLTQNINTSSFKQPSLPRMPSTGLSRWNTWNSTFSTSTTPLLTLSGDFRQADKQEKNRCFSSLKRCFSELQKIVNRQLGPGDGATQSHSWHDQCGRAQGGQLKGDAEKIDFCKNPQKPTIWRSSGWQGARQSESGRHPITGGVIFQTVAVGFIFVNWKFLFKVLSVEGNHLLALPEDFDVQVGSLLLAHIWEPYPHCI